MKDRGETYVEIFFRALGQAMAMQSRDPGRSSDLDMLAALFAKDRALRLKRAMAEQFESMGGMALGLDGPEGSTIITERNKRAMSVLSKQIERGHKRIGIFFGAAHMPDMQRRLTEQFAMEQSGQRWIPAWDLSPAATKR
jgi:hypothetical protein